MITNPVASNPAELAIPFIDIIDTRGQNITDDEEKALAELDRLTEVAEMHGSYFSQVGRALAIPAYFEDEELIRVTSFGSLSFEGNLITYSVVKIGKVIGSTSVRALCVTFDQVTLLPFFDTLPDDQLLHVPALAVDSMIRTDT